MDLCSGVFLVFSIITLVVGMENSGAISPIKTMDLRTKSKFELMKIAPAATQDRKSIYFIHTSDAPGSCLVSQRLKGDENYYV